MQDPREWTEFIIPERPASWMGKIPEEIRPQPTARPPGLSQPGRYRASSAPAPPASISPAPGNPLDPSPPISCPQPSVLGLAGAAPALAASGKPQTPALCAQTSSYKRAGCRKSLSIQGEFAHVCRPTLSVRLGKGLTVGPTAPGGPCSPLVPRAPAMPWKPCQDAEVRA